MYDMTENMEKFFMEQEGRAMIIFENKIEDNPSDKISGIELEFMLELKRMLDIYSRVYPDWMVANMDMSRNTDWYRTRKEFVRFLLYPFLLPKQKAPNKFTRVIGLALSELKRTCKRYQKMIKK